MIKGKMLITADAYFIAPDGREYKAAWGEVQVYSDKESLGIQTNERSTNWYVKIGDNKRGMIIAGCQIHFATICPNKPNANEVPLEYNGTHYIGHSRIYIAEETDE